MSIISPRTIRFLARSTKFTQKRLKYFCADLDFANKENARNILKLIFRIAETQGKLLNALAVHKHDIELLGGTCNELQKQIDQLNAKLKRYNKAQPH
ncbi:hypothetical protein ID0469_06110 [Helicobacter pylori]